MISLSSRVQEEDAVVQSAVAVAVRAARERERAAGTGSRWGSLLSLAGLGQGESEPTAEELLSAFSAALSSLGPAALLAVGLPLVPSRRRPFALAFSLAASHLIPSLDCPTADDLWARANSLHASAEAALGKVPQIMVDHAKVVIDWMQWRLDHDHLYDTVLFYVVEAEYRLIDAKAPSLLSRPSESTIAQAEALLERIEFLKERIIAKNLTDVDWLSGQIEANAARISALRATEIEIDRIIQQKQTSKK